MKQAGLRNVKRILLLSPPNLTTSRILHSFANNNPSSQIHSFRQCPCPCPTSSLYYTNDIHAPRFTISRSFVVQVNVGHGPSFSLDPNAKIAISPEQRKASEMELKRMSAITRRILDQSPNDITSMDKSLVNEIRVALHYWSSRWIVRYHPFFSAHATHVESLLLSSKNDGDNEICGDYGPRQAEKIVRWILKADKIGPGNALIDRILAVDNNAAIANIIDGYLLLCTTNMTFKEQHEGLHSHQHNPQNPQNHHTNDDFLHLASITGTHKVNRSTWIPSIFRASNTIDVMYALHYSDNVALMSDTTSHNAILHTWSKLAMLLAAPNSDGGGGGNHDLNGRPDMDWTACFEDDKMKDNNERRIPSTCRMNSVQQGETNR